MSYAAPADIPKFGINAKALAGISDPDKQTALDGAFGKINGYLRSDYSLPLVAPIPVELKRCECILAAYDLLTSRGRSAEAADEAIRQRYEDEIAWLKDIASRRVVLACTQTEPTTETVEVEVFVNSLLPRGW